MERVYFMCGLETQPKAKNYLTARLHGTSATGTTIMGVTDTYCTKWVQDPLTAIGSANIHCHS